MDISRNDNIALCAYYRTLADVSVYSYRSVIENISVKSVDVSVYDKNVLNIYPVFVFIEDYVAVFFRNISNAVGTHRKELARKLRQVFARFFLDYKSRDRSAVNALYRRRIYCNGLTRFYHIDEIDGREVHSSVRALIRCRRFVFSPLHIIAAVAALFKLHAPCYEDLARFAALFGKELYIFIYKSILDIIIFKHGIDRIFA